MRLSRFFVLLIGVLVTSIAISSLMMLPLPASGIKRPAATPMPQNGDRPARFEIQRDGQVMVDGLRFENLPAYITSDYFRETGKRCGTEVHFDVRSRQADPGDCTLARTIIQNEYWPNEVYVIPTVFHVIYAGDGTGNIPDQRIYDQMQVLNEDFQAMAGSSGANGVNTKIHFQLAGITRTRNDAWFDDTDELAYKQALGWDQDRYLNVYTNSASGYLGYSYLPQDNVDKVYDGVVALYEVVGGRDLPGVDPYDQGRTLVHETGHYLGLLHTFEGYGCFEGYEAGDLIADTPSEEEEHYSCEQTYTCGTPDDIHNYMNYTDDVCMQWFTREQANRAICALINYRPQLFKTGALAIIQQVSPDPVQAGAPLTYTLYVTNTGEIDLHTTIVDTLPAHIVGDALAGDATVLPGGRLQWSPTLTTPGGVWIQTVVVTTEVGYTGPLTNVVQVTTTEGVTGTHTVTSQMQATPTPAVVVSKTATPDPVYAGEQLTYTLHVTNTGAIPLNATITDTLPAHVQVGALARGTAVLPGGVLVWTATLPVDDGFWTRTVVVTVETAYSGALSNMVQVTTEQGVNGMATATTTVLHRLHLPLVLRDS